MGVNRIDWTIPRFEIGFWCRTTCQRAGYMTEALVTLVEFIILLSIGILGLLVLILR